MDGGERAEFADIVEAQSIDQAPIADKDRDPPAQFQNLRFGKMLA